MLFHISSCLFEYQLELGNYITSIKQQHIIRPTHVPRKYNVCSKCMLKWNRQILRYTHFAICSTRFHSADAVGDAEAAAAMLHQILERKEHKLGQTDEAASQAEGGRSAQRNFKVGK